MTLVLQYAVLGLASAAVLSLLAQGLVVTYAGSGVLNFAQAAIAMLSAYLFWDARVGYGWAFWQAALFAVGTMTIGGVAVYYLVMRPLRNASAVARTVASLGILTTIQGAVGIKWGEVPRSVNAFFPAKVYEIHSVIIPADRLYLFGIAVVLTLLLWAGFRFTPIGLAIRAGAENPRAAATLGWSPHFLAAVTWGLGSGLAGLAGVLIAPVTGINSSEMPYYILPVLAAALVGGFTSFWLTLVAALGLAVVQSEFVNYWHVWGLADSFPFLVIMVILFVRGKGLPVRGHIAERLPELGTGKVWWRWLAVLAVVYGACLIWLFPTTLTDALSISAAWGIVMLSVVVLIGFTGQLSLAQFGLAGVSALLAAELVARLHLPFVAAFVLAVVATVPVGLVFAVPALRTRGINLAVVTFGLAMSLNAMVFTNPRFVNGYGTIHVGRISLGGFEIDALDHSNRYVIVVTLCLIACALVVANLRRSSVGRRLIAVRTNERAAAALGISVFQAKLYAFALAGLLAGVGGVLLAFRNPNAVFSDFSPLQSVLAVGYAVIGGVGFALGAPFGSQLPAGGLGGWIMDEIFPNADANWLVVIAGITMILLVVLHPDGAISVQAKGIKALRRRLSRRRVAAPASAASLAAPADASWERVEGGVLEARNITVRFGGTVAVNDVSIRLEPGRVVGLIGPNGAGKTTLIDAITGFVTPTTGTVTFNDQRVDRWPVHRRSRLGLSRSFQQLELFESATVRENLAVASDPHTYGAYLTDLLWPRKAVLSAPALAAVRTLELDEYLDARVSDLPYGRRRLVAIARAVATKPSVLMLDEPAAGLSGGESSELAVVVRRLASEWGLSILLVEHDMSFVMRLCDHLHVLDFGRQIAAGPPAEIRRDPAVVAAYLGGAEAAEDDAPQPVLDALGGER